MLAWSYLVRATAWCWKMSMSPPAETNLTVPTFWPREWFPQNFAGVFAERSNFSALVDSFIIATANTALSLFLGSLAGYAFARFPRQAGGEPC